MNYANKKFCGDEFILFLDKLAFANLYTFLEIFYHRNMKKILFVLIALFSLNYCFSQEEEFPASESGILELTDNEQKAISDMFDFSLAVDIVIIIRKEFINRTFQKNNEELHYIYKRLIEKVD
mgnify:CR=1 FL=1